jgi:hypothetical protein
MPTLITLPVMKPAAPTKAPLDIVGVGHFFRVFSVLKRAMKAWR